MLKLKVNSGKHLVLKAAANRGQKHQANSVSVSVTLECDAICIGSENPKAKAFFFALLVGDSVPKCIPIHFTYKTHNYHVVYVTFSKVVTYTKYQ